MCACVRLYITQSKTDAVLLLLNDSLLVDSLLVDSPQGITSEVVSLTQDDIPKESCNSYSCHHNTYEYNVMVPLI